jgi:hypothetical protein
VIKEHFTLRRAAIRAKIAKWATEDARMTHWDARTMAMCGTQPPSLGGGGGSGSMNLVEEVRRGSGLAFGWHPLPVRAV